MAYQIFKRDEPATGFDFLNDSGSDIAAGSFVEAAPTCSDLAIWTTQGGTLASTSISAELWPPPFLMTQMLLSLCH